MCCLGLKTQDVCTLTDGVFSNTELYVWMVAFARRIVKTERWEEERKAREKSNGVEERMKVKERELEKGTKRDGKM